MVDIKGPDTRDSRNADVSGEVQEHTPSQLTPVADESASKIDLEKSAENALEKALKESEDNRDRWLRAVAELENFKKRSINEKARLLKYKEEDILKELLPVVDNLERALTHGEKNDKSDPVTDGVKMVLGMFGEVLKKYGCTQIDSLGKTFDPQVHEAIAQQPVKNVAPNTVTQQLERGYMYKDKLLRPAKVIVSTVAE
ncbi:MAG: nucleotide exchange factor GrpE [Desulfomonilaceae bacterium]